MKQLKHSLNAQVLINKTNAISVLTSTPKQLLKTPFELLSFSKVSLLKATLVPDLIKKSIKFPVTFAFINSLKAYFTFIALNKTVKIVYIKLFNYYLTNSKLLNKFKSEQILQQFTLQLSQSFLVLSCLKIWL